MSRRRHLRRLKKGHLLQVSVDFKMRKLQIAPSKRIYDRSKMRQLGMGAIDGANNSVGVLPSKWVFSRSETHVRGMGAIPGPCVFLKSFVVNGNPRKRKFIYLVWARFRWVLFFAPYLVTGSPIKWEPIYLIRARLGNEA